MADTAAVVTPEMAEEFEFESHAPYVRVWAILAILTAIEYFYALIFKDHFLVLVLGLVSLALVKAGMVGWFFMHLKFEKPWVYILIVPAGVMAVFLTLALYPDMAMKPVTEENPGEEEEVWTAPAPAIPGGPMIRLVGPARSCPTQSSGRILPRVS
jgi:cytochrome c oxidase subunit 4